MILFIIEFQAKTRFAEIPQGEFVEKNSVNQKVKARE